MAAARAALQRLDAYLENVMVPSARKPTEPGKSNQGSERA